MERDDERPPRDDGDADDVDELLDQFGDAKETKGIDPDELERRIRERRERGR